jgi:hypothetical protein
MVKEPAVISTVSGTSIPSSWENALPGTPHAINKTAKKIVHRDNVLFFVTFLITAPPLFGLKSVYVLYMKIPGQAAILLLDNTAITA